MFRLEKRFTFEASHQLTQHDGKCRRLHGHSWGAVVILTGRALMDIGPKAGMLLDYETISGAVKPIIEQYLDHWHLNDTLPLPDPTSEAVARWLFAQLAGTAIGEYLHAVRIEETCTSAAEYTYELGAR